MITSIACREGPSEWFTVASLDFWQKLLLEFLEILRVCKLLFLLLLQSNLPVNYIGVIEKVSMLLLICVSDSVCLVDVIFLTSQPDTIFTSLSSISRECPLSLLQLFHDMCSRSFFMENLNI